MLGGAWDYEGGGGWGCEVPRTDTRSGKTLELVVNIGQQRSSAVIQTRVAQPLVQDPSRKQ